MFPRNLSPLQGRPLRFCRIDVGRDEKNAVDPCEDRAMSAIGVFRPEVVCEEGTVASIEGES